ncbi:sugar-phosphatase [Bacillus safensis]|uniref:sugar-phosphatase n=1 Tax=Bacillus safensis TaxID=561879 RepID=UPI000EF2D618|nr:sugar-phosphatase [Bacillus safensis]AYJ88234.1 sugar-phosphatase [Bacillus safensis]
MYKLVAIDMDGTLLNDQHMVPDEVFEAIQQAKAEGIKIVLCTGRPIGGVNRYLADLQLDQEGDYVIAYNGALVQNSHTNEVVSELTLSYDDLTSLYELSRQLDTPMHYFDSANLYTPNRDISEYTVLESYLTKLPLKYMPVEEADSSMRLPKMMYIDQPERLEKTIQAIPSEVKEKYMMVKSTDFFLEILHPDVSKGNAVKLLAKELGIPREEVMAIGDNGNDVSMLEFAGCGVAMGNAIDDVKAVADVVTKSNNEAGVAHVLHDLVLGK